MVLCVSLNTTKDIIVPVYSFDKGSVLRTPSIIDYPAGKAVNSARAIASLGGSVTAAGFCGRQDLAYTKNYLSGHKIKTDFTPVSGSNRICVLINEVESSLETVINSESAFHVTKKDEALLIKKAALLSKKASCCIVSGSLPLGCSEGFYSRLLDALSDNTKIIADTSKAALRTASEKKPFILKANLQEFQESFCLQLDSFVAMRSFAIKLLDKGIENIIITLGEKGSFIVNSSGAYIASCKAAAGDSPVGCGDAFNAGLAFGIDNRMDIPDCIRYASAAAAANLMSYGSCFIEKKQVMSQLKAVKIKKA